MPAPEFAHLRLRTEYSIKEGIARLQGNHSIIVRATSAQEPVIVSRPVAWDWRDNPKLLRDMEVG